MIPVAENYEAHKGHKLHAANIKALKVLIVTGGSRISVVDLYRSPRSMQVKHGKLFLFLSVVPMSAGKFLILGDFDAPGFDWVCTTVLEAIFGHQLVQFMHE